MAATTQNVLEIVIKGTDQSGGAINKAANAAKSFKRDIDSVGKAFSSVGSVVGVFNAELGHAVNAISHFASQSKQLQAELGNSKAAMAALGFAAAATGYAIGVSLYDFATRGDAKKAADSLELLTIRMRTLNELINDPRSKAMNQIDNEIEMQIKKIEMMSVAEAEKQAAILELRKFQELQKVRVVQDANSKIAGFQEQAAEREKKALTDLNTFAEESNKRSAEQSREFEETVREDARETTRNLQQQLQERESLETYYNEGRVADYIESINSMRFATEADIEQRKEFLAAYRETWMASHRSMFSYAAEGVKTVTQGLGNAIVDVAMQTKSASEAFADLGKAIARMFLQWIASRILAFVAEKALAAIGLSLAATQAQAVSVFAAGAAASWAPAATAALVATLGSAGAFAGLLTPLMALNQASALSLSLAGGMAHGGASFIPQESTYLLNKGERVLSPRQNEDLTSFMESGSGRPVVVQIDGRKLGDELYQMSRDGRLRIDGRAVV